MISPISHKRAINNNNNNNKGSKQTPEETERTPANQDASPPMKKRTASASFSLESAGLFEATTAAASRDFSMLFSKFSEVFSERAAADTSQMKELEVILTEAQDLESYLKEKKKHLRQTLSLISERLLG
ncbi:Testis-expressed sequence 12 protein [Liparis tanakae]|uniref:Testis-expressed sequence 12 protein n=1 Tax=Liparis tanakae TaxID=230148 RepID=A0A4Z2EZV6_9TELE|nr:Testis-expressed sequence 12 protein [Liparis tanakae]